LGKAILLIILVLGAGFYFPTTRPTLLDVLGPLINPALAMQCSVEMDKITRELQISTRNAQPVPAQGQAFSNWMIGHFRPEGTRDSWGNEYSLINWTDSVGVVSRGPDLEIGTADDILRTIRLQRWNRRR
jgi:hypothetical protein